MQFFIVEGLLYEECNKFISFIAWGKLIKYRIQNTGINLVTIVKSWKIYIVKIIQGTSWEPFFAPSRTKGEFFPCFLSSESWWKWEQNNTRVVAYEGPEPSYIETFQGISSK